MTLQQLINAYYDTISVSYEDEQQALDTIFERSDFILSRQDFARDNISQDAAEAIALSNKYFISDYLENHKPPIEIIASTVIAHPSDLAHHLAVSEPATATELLDELLYWRKQGRI